MRLLWLVPVMTPLSFNTAPKYAGWSFLYYVKAAIELFVSAQVDKALRQKILEQGVVALISEALLAKGCTPLSMTREQFEASWTLFGSVGPAFSGPFVPDDEPPAEGAAEAAGGDTKESSFYAAALKHFESTGADVEAEFKDFDVDGSGTIDMMELMACAVACGSGFKTMADAEAAMARLDLNGNGTVSLSEFKEWLKIKPKE
jgi:hypothetical protein